jgi:glutamyl-tRNA reductase
VIGAGQTNILMSNFLKKYDFVKEVSVFNRTLDKAQSLADKMQGQGFTLDALSTFKGGFDIMIVCTGSTEKFVDPALYTSLLQGETDQKIIVDLSVPSNIDPDVLATNDINFIEIESLKKLAADNLSFRKNEIAKVKEILADRVTEFKEIYRQREIERDISHIPVAIKAVKDKAINVVFKKQLDKVDAETRDLIEEMMTYMEKKCIAVPIKKAKEVLPSPTK